MNIHQPLKPLISLIIPTRERADTLFFAIKTALNQNSNSYEVIVSDNFSQDNTKEVVCGFNDPRLIYINTGRRLSMCDNWDFALDHAKGEYIIFIGDDDAVMPGAIDKLQATIQNKHGLVYFWPKPYYAWPKNNHKASVPFLPSNFHPYEINLKKSIKFVISMGGARHASLPTVYHGAVAKSILDKIKERTGRVFHSTYPDVFIAFSLPAFSEIAINVGYIVTVDGQSPKSNSAVLAYGGTDGIIIHEKYLKEFGGYKIHSSLFPERSLLSNLLPDTILVAMDKFPQFYNDMQFNYSAAWAYSIRHSKYLKWGVTLRDIIQKKHQIRNYHPFSILQFSKYYVIHKIFEIYRNIYTKNIKRKPFLKSVPDNIGEFVNQLSDYQITL